MSLIDELLQHYRERRAQMLDDVKHWRSHGWRLHENNKDITEQWLTEQERRATDLAGIIVNESNGSEIAICGVSFYRANCRFSRGPRPIDENSFFSSKAAGALI